MRITNVIYLSFLVISLSVVGCTNIPKSSTTPKPIIKSKILMASKEQSKSIPLLQSSEYGIDSIEGYESLCSDDCDDIDANANPDIIDEAAIIEYDPSHHRVDGIDNSAATTDIKLAKTSPGDMVVDNGDIVSVGSNGSQLDENHAPNDNELNLGVEHVPLNAISPETIETFVEVIDVIRHDYVRPVNDELLFQDAITGMLEKLDSHAEYLTPENYERLRNFTDGEIGHVGIIANFDPLKSAWVVTEVLPHSSAKEAGINIGDRLLKIKKAVLTSDMTPQDVSQLLSGIAGSQVQVTVASNYGQKRNVILQRNLASNNRLIVTVQDSIAIIRLPVFQNGSRDQLIKALKDLGVPITGVVLDVRNNPGGVLSAAIDIASLFIADKGLIQVRNRTNHSQIIKPNGTPYLSDLPVVVLQNQYSASAAEVLASSLKSNQRAKIIGEQSFGKGTVQEVIPLKSGGAVKLTVAEYRSVKGEMIDGIGVKPDITLIHDGTDWQQRAVNVLLAQDRPIGIKFNNNLDGLPVINDY